MEIIEQVYLRIIIETIPVFIDLKKELFKINANF